MPSACTGDIIAGKFRIERLLGNGGMGYVFAARHIDLDQLVAIKFLTRGALADDEEAYARFRLEARSTVRLTSEHIAKVHDVGVHENDEPYIVMEYLDGVDLGAIAKQRGTVSVAEACDYVLQACDGLGEAHSVGIVHRDVKLANLFVTKRASGRPLLKVLDFGVSKSSRDGASLDFTRTETMLGSPRFMSPEQMNDPRSVDGRTDVWSLGVVLYRLVGGRAPFEGDTIGRVCAMVLTEEPAPLGTLRQDLPNGFEQVVSRCLAKDRAHRISDVASLAAALAPYASDPEAALDRAHHIAAMLGVPLPPVEPVLPPHSCPHASFPPTMLMVPAPAPSASGSFSASGSPNATGENISPPAARERVISAATMVLTAIAVVFFVAGFAVFRVSSANAIDAAAGARPPPPAVVLPAPAPSPAAPPRAMPAAAPTSAALAIPVAPAAAAPKLVPHPPVRRPLGRAAKTNARAAVEDAPPSDGVPIPSDRR